MNEHAAALVQLARVCEVMAQKSPRQRASSIHAPSIGSVAVVRLTLGWRWTFVDLTRPRTGSRRGRAWTCRAAWLAAREAILRANP